MDRSVLPAMYGFTDDNDIYPAFAAFGDTCT
jgi:hypothetical protein